MRIPLLALALTAVSVLSLVSPSNADAKNAQIDQPFIDKLIKKSSVSEVSMSPNGKYYSFLGMSKDGLRTLVINRVDDDSNVTFARYPNANVSRPIWATGKNIIFRVTKLDKKGYGERGDLNVFNLDVESKDIKAIWGSAKGKVRGSSKNNKLAYLDIMNRLRNDDEHVLTQITTRERHPRVQIYKFDINTGDSDLQVQTKLKLPAVATDPNGKYFVASGKLADYSDRVEFYAPQEGWTPLKGFDSKTQSFTPYGISSDGQLIYGEYQLKGDINNPVEFISWNTGTGKRSVFLSVNRATIESISYDQTTETPIYATTNEGGEKTHYFQPEHPYAKLHKKLKKQFKHDRVNLGNYSGKHDMVAISVSSGVVPRDTYFANLNSNKVDFKFAALDQFTPDQLSAAKYVSWPSFDGTKIGGWLTTPNKASDKPPLVVLIHGGPHGPYDRDSYDPWVQMLAHHGYAVLKVNYRGSGGEGENFISLGYGEWGRGMLDDVRAGAEFLQKTGQVDEKRVCSMGFSYGGYATAMNMVRHADFYKCGVIGGGVFSFEQQMASSDIRALTFGDSYQNLAYGPKEDWHKYSSLARASEIVSPVILFHGREDRRTPFKGAVAFEKALKKAGVDYEKHWWPREGHGLSHDKTKQNFYENTLKFLAKNL